MNKSKWYFTAILLALVTMIAFSTGIATVDYFPSLRTYGVSVGSNTRYCSAEIVRGSLTWTCEDSGKAPAPEIGIAPDGRPLIIGGVGIPAK